jgi:Ca2+-binding RTX toxin-like protein
VKGTLTVTTAALTITAKVNNPTQSKVYGTANPPLTYTVAGLVGSDALSTAPTVTTTATTLSHVGNYDVTASGAVATADYTVPLNYVKGTLTVTPANLTITADNKPMFAGGAMPTFTATCTGYVCGDTDAVLTKKPSFSTTATPTSPTGTYLINVGGAASADYTFTYVPGTLTVYATVNAVYQIPDPLDPTQQALYVWGTAGNDTLKVTSTKIAGQVLVTFNGKSRGTFQPTGRIVMHGLAGTDNILVANTITLPAWLYGEDGNDVLTGDAGPNVLLGGAGKDTLWGGKGRSLLIGGAGTDSVSSGLGDALLIGKSTDFDANDTALLALLNEWNSAASYATRMAHITGTAGGLNGSSFLNVATIHSDGSKDTLIGNATAMDMFFQHVGDTLKSKRSNETVLSV